MRSVVLGGPRRLELQESGDAHSHHGEAVVRPRVNGICGSDLAAYRGTAPQITYPRVLGHEVVGDVVSCTDQPDLVGARVVVEPLVSCGACRACRIGRRNCCARLRVLGVQIDGTLADEFAVDVRQVYRVPDGLPDDVAVLAEPTSVAYHAVQRAGVDAGQVAVVFGAGTIGLLVTQLLLRARGCRVVAVDVDSSRLEVAAKLGAVPAANDDRLVDVVADLSGGELADVVVEATGHPSCTRRTTEVAAAAGRIVLVGWNPGPVEIDTVTLMRKEIDLLGSRTTVGAFPSVVRLLEDGTVDARTLVTHHVDFADATEAFRLLEDADEHALKVVIHHAG